MSDRVLATINDAVKYYTEKEGGPPTAIYLSEKALREYLAVMSYDEEHPRPGNALPLVYAGIPVLPDPSMHWYVRVA